MAYTCRVVHKVDYNKQFFFDVPNGALPALKESSVRIKPTLIGLQGSSNLSYCSHGTTLAWWDAWPAPSYAPAPYNDVSTYGVAPAWGFATVMQSNIADISTGTVFWGFMPTHACPVDLQLEQDTDVPNHWVEVSSERSKLMPLYNRYPTVAASALDESNLTLAAYTATMRSVWECGYVINRFNFPYDKEDPCLHPMPEAGLPWSKEDGDVREALVISLAAGGKTSRSFVQQMATTRPQGSGPLGLLEVSSNAESILAGRKMPFEHQIVTYKDALEKKTLDWIKALNIKKVVIIENGGRDNIAEKLVEMFKTELSSARVYVVVVGNEMKISSPKELQEQFAYRTRSDNTPMNTSGVRDAAMKELGAKRYFEELQPEWKRVVEDEAKRHGSSTVLGVPLKVGKGVKGEQGLEGNWTAICEGRNAGEGMAFWV